jgi:hypothetical protein
MDLIPDSVVRSLGGLAARRELERQGCPPDWIDIALAYGKIERVRQGWYSVPEMPDLLKQAWRVGGRLACASAAHFHGLGSQPPPELHVSVARNSAKLRVPTNRFERLSANPTPTVRVHWDDEYTTEQLRGEARQAVGSAKALWQAARCPRAGGRMLALSATDTL